MIGKNCLHKECTKSNNCGIIDECKILTNWAGNTSRKFDQIYNLTNVFELVNIVSNIQKYTPIIISAGNLSWSS